MMRVFLSLAFPMVKELIPPRRRLSAIALATAALTVFFILMVADPNARDSVLPPCPFHALTHLYCPGCGTTRALHALLHGNFGLALKMNSLAVLVVPLLPLMIWNSWHPGRAWLARVSDARMWVPVVLAFTFLRNLPWLPFAWLAPV